MIVYIVKFDEEDFIINELYQLTNSDILFLNLSLESSAQEVDTLKKRKRDDFFEDDENRTRLIVYIVKFDEEDFIINELYQLTNSDILFLNNSFEFDDQEVDTLRDEKRDDFFEDDENRTRLIVYIVKFDEENFIINELYQLTNSNILFLNLSFESSVQKVDTFREKKRDDFFEDDEDRTRLIVYIVKFDEEDFIINELYQLADSGILFLDLSLESSAQEVDTLREGKGGDFVGGGRERS